ncbi:MAG TPA: SDR family oxidoreductase [Hyphomicrobiaceae bacterium]|nr:SDR family oxidoreductase [Hyphomicrobiaceae bacterium]
MRKTILITGGSRGIGAATAIKAAEAGYDVAINYVSNAAAAEAVVAACRKAGAKAEAYKADTSNPEEIAALFKWFDKTFGRMDAFFNNAGIVGPTARFEDIPLKRLQDTIAVNTVGAFVAAQEAVRRMSTRHGGKGGAIVNMSSIAAKIGGSGAQVDYAASKGAIDTMTVGLAKEVADEGVRVNAVRPGLIYTDIHASMGVPDRVDQLKHLIPMKRGGTAEEVANAVIWLCSDASSYTTGTLVDVTGGRGL